MTILEEIQTEVTFWELLERIVKEPAPTLPTAAFSKELCNFVSSWYQETPTSF